MYLIKIRNLNSVYFCVLKVFLKVFKIFLFFSLIQNNFLVFLDHSNVLISKIIFKK